MGRLLWSLEMAWGPMKVTWSLEQVNKDLREFIWSHLGRSKHTWYLMEVTWSLGGVKWGPRKIN